MTGKLEAVIFRNETPAPTEPGWYYGMNLEWPEGIVPLWVTVCQYFVAGDGIGAFEAENELPIRLHKFRWFGPVPVVREG